MVERREEEEETDERTDERTTDRPTDRPTVSPSPRELLILSFSVSSSRVTSSPALSRLSPCLSFSPREDTRASPSVCLSSSAKIRGEKGTRLLGELGEGFRHYTRSIRLTFSPTSSRIFLLSRMMLFQHADIANLVSRHHSLLLFSSLIRHQNC